MYHVVPRVARQLRRPHADLTYVYHTDAHSSYIARRFASYPAAEKIIARILPRGCAILSPVLLGITRILEGVSYLVTGGVLANHPCYIGRCYNNTGGVSSYHRGGVISSPVSGGVISSPVSGGVILSSVLEGGCYIIASVLWYIPVVKKTAQLRPRPTTGRQTDTAAGSNCANGCARRVRRNTKEGCVHGSQQRRR